MLAQIQIFESTLVLTDDRGVNKIRSLYFINHVFIGLQNEKVQLHTSKRV